MRNEGEICDIILISFKEGVGWQKVLLCVGITSTLCAIFGKNLPSQALHAFDLV